MNKQCFRVIFNKTLQRFVVVSELAKIEGKSKEGREKFTFSRHSYFAAPFLAALRPLSFSLFCAFGFVLFPNFAQAETLIIRADESAPKNQQPIILQTANGLPQVNIQTPNDKGLSHNKYSKFDVDTKGAILNNSRKNAQTQQAGWVQGNPYLAKGEAKVILNEVNSNDPSILKGYVEVVGQKADVIIANPSGIHCRGCGVINSDRVTFSTGKPQIKNGNLEGFVVEKGKFQVDGKGLDNSRVDYTEILAREVKANAGIWSKKEVNVITGKNTVKRLASESNNGSSANASAGANTKASTNTTAGALQILHTEQTQTQPTETTPQFVVDVGELGGMYAGKIHLIGTEAGLGVRNAGHIGASSDSLHIDSLGRIVNTGTLNAAQSLALKTAQAIENKPTGKIENRQGDIRLNSQTDIKQDGAVVARLGNLHLDAKGHIAQQGVVNAASQVKAEAKTLTQEAKGEMQGADVRLLAKEKITNRGLINSHSSSSSSQSSSTTVLKAKQIENIGTGRIYGDKVALEAERFTNQDEKTTELSSPIVAARARLDFGVKQLINESQFYSGHSHSASAIYSAGELYLGGALDGENNATGRASLFENKSALFESQGKMVLKSQEIRNENPFFKTELKLTSEKEVNWSYIVPKGALESELRLDTSLLTWWSQSRGRNGWRVNGKPTDIQKPANGDVQSNYLPLVNQCASGQTGENCDFIASSYYFPNDAAWQYFALKPQMRANVADILNQAKVPVAPIAPVEPAKPADQSASAQAAYQAKLSAYQQAKSQYDVEYKKYLEEKAYFDQYVKPAYLEWVKDNQTQFNELRTLIEQHNQRRAAVAGQSYRDYWQTKVKRQQIKEDVVTETQAGEILSGGDLIIDTDNLINDKSRILSGGDLQITGNLDNRNALGQQITDTFGDKHYSYLRKRKSVDKRGRRKYKREEISHQSGLLSSISQPITLPVATVFEHYQFDNTSLVKKDTGSALSLPHSSLYKLNPNADSHILVETDPAFTNRRKWLSSDYMFNALRHEHENVHKRLGDGYYEQRLVREQINSLTGRMFTDNHKDFDSQYQALMDNGITFAQKFNLRLGIALSAAQVAQLTSDIVWFEAQEVSLPDGRTQTVLAPKVYLANLSTERTETENNETKNTKTNSNKTANPFNSRGSLLSAARVVIEGDVNNQAIIAGRELVSINSLNLHNQGDIAANRIQLNAKNNLTNLGGQIVAEESLSLSSQKDLTLASTLATTSVEGKQYRREDTHLARKALLYVKGQNGSLQLSANNLNLKGAEILNAGEGQTRILANNQLTLEALTTQTNEHIGNGNHYRRERVQDTLITHIQGGNVHLQGKQIVSEGAKIEAKGKLTALAQNDLILKSTEKQAQLEEYHYQKSNNGISKTTQTTLDTKDSITKQGSQLSAQQIQLLAGNNLSAKNVEIVADKDIHIQAQNQLEIGADTNYSKETHYSKTTKSGVFSGGRLGITAGKKSETLKAEEEGWKQSEARTVIGSMQGDVHLVAGKSVVLVGADVITNANEEKNIKVQAEKIKVETSQDVLKQKESYEFKQTGLTLALSTPVTDLAFNAMDSLKRSEQVKSSKLAQLYQLKAAQEMALAAKQAAPVAQTLANAGEASLSQQANTQSPSVKISLSIGTQKNTRESQAEQITHQASNLSAANLQLQTTKGDIDVIGSHLQANNITLHSANDIHLVSAEDRFTHRSTNKNMGASIGVFVGMSGNSMGMGIEGAANIGKGRENSDSLTQKNTTLKGKNIHLTSQQDTALQGAQVNAEHLNVQVGNNLKIESRQDSNRYDSKQTQANAGVSVAIYGTGSSASVSASQSKAKLNYAQVEEQSGLYVGEGGLALQVGNHTHLKGGLIKSEAEASKNQFNTKSFSTEDIQNHSEVKSQSMSAGFSTGNMMQNAMSALGTVASALGNKNESNQSTTKSAVSDNIHINASSEDSQTQLHLNALSRDVEKANQKVEKYNLSEIQEQQEMAKVIGDIANNSILLTLKPKLDEAEKQKAEANAILANKNSSESQRNQAQQQLEQATQTLNQYGQSSDIQLAVRAVTGLLQGLATKNTGAAVVGALSPYANLAIKNATTDPNTKEVNITANLMAHALLGAIEAKATGNNALAGAVGAITGEVAAKVITEKLYNKPVEELTESEKQTVSALSQLAGGLAGGLVGDSSASGLSSSEIAKRAVENNYLFRHEAEERSRLIKERDECRKKGGDCTKIENRITELTQLDHSRNKKLEEACGYKMTPACAKELVTLSAAHTSFKDYKPHKGYDHFVYSDFKEVEELYGEAQSRRMEHLAKQALLDISAREPVESAVTLTRITIDALKGDEAAKAQLRQIGNEIKKAALSPIDTISETTRTELKQADELEAAGYRDEADLIRMKVYLSNEITAIGAFSSVSRLIHSSVRNVGKLAIKEGVLSNKEVNIAWGKGIQKQGKAWEEYLQKTLPEGTLDLNQIKPNFKTFDRLLPDGTAISAKTMDTVGSKTYQDPKRITYQLNKYVDDMVKFDRDGRGGMFISNEQIKSKEMYLAIPSGSTKQQMDAINVSLDYAKSKGIKIIVKEIK